MPGRKFEASSPLEGEGQPQRVHGSRVVHCEVVAATAGDPSLAGDADDPIILNFS
ncbi:MAG: hypothetical protein R6X25_06455 [Candidatus Krumholzibacteriia bacterium]